jgi:hypothetical protein
MSPIQIEFFPDAEENGLILLHGNDPQAARRLQEQVASLTSKQVQHVAIHEIPGFESVDGCRLYFTVGQSDFDTLPLRAKNEFSCELDSISWENIVGVLEPFTERMDHDGFQWLDSSYGGIAIIISTFRGW